MNTNEEMKRNGGAFPDDAWVDHLLREDAAHQPHIDDAGFSASVMAALPVRPRRVASWLVPAITMLGCVLAAVVTPTWRYAAGMLVQMADPRQLSASSLVALAPIAVFYFCCLVSVRD